MTEKNPVQSDIQGMTVFNTEDVDTKKQPMFFGQPLGYKDMIVTSIQYLKI